MISISKAIETIKNNLPEPRSQELLVSNSLRSVISQDIHSPVSLPLFDNSAMDGYAICYGPNEEYGLIGEIKAGDNASQIYLQENQAIRIFTGAMIPLNCTHVVRQEDANKHVKIVTFDVFPKDGGNIRKKGTEINQGELILHKGTTITPGTIGLLKSLGLETISAYSNPSVAIVSTGNELQLAGTDLKPGQIFESNSEMLRQAILQVEQCESDVYYCSDNQLETEQLIAKLLESYDILVFTGGISVGDYDFVGKSLLKNGVDELFYKVEQKPGKPLWFGAKKDTLCFAFPGNPAAALTCFYIYMKPVLAHLKGRGFAQLEQINATLKSPIDKPNGRSQFLKAHLINGEVEVLDRQSSSMLKSFSESNAIAFLPANEKRAAGSSILIYKLPN